LGEQAAELGQASGVPAERIGNRLDPLLAVCPFGLQHRERFEFASVLLAVVVAHCLSCRVYRYVIASGRRPVLR